MLVVVVLPVLLLLTRGGRLLGRLIVYGFAGPIVPFLTNPVLAGDVPVNLLTIPIWAIGGVLGWLPSSWCSTCWAWLFPA